MTLREIRRVRWSDEDRYPFNPDVIQNFKSLDIESTYDDYRWG